MKTIYIDSLFALNFIIDYILVLATAKLCSLEIKRRRFMLAAAAGALYSVLMFFPSMSVLFGWSCRILFAAVMSVIAFGFRGFGKTVRSSITLFICSALLAGMSLFCCYLFGGGINLRNGIPYIGISFKILLASALICYAVLTVIFRGRAGDGAKRQIITLNLRDGGKSLRIRALADTGCSLRDPVCGKSVIVCDLCPLLPFFDSDAAGILCKYAKTSPVECMERLAAITDIRKFRIVPYRTISDGSGVMLAFCPELIERRGEGKISAVIGISQTEICSDLGYNALIGAV